MAAAGAATSTITTATTVDLGAEWPITSTKRNNSNNNNPNFNSAISSSPRQSFERKYNENSPPHTAREQIGRASRIKGIKAPRNRPSVRDTFDDQQSFHTRDRSNSNGLSWSPKYARNSIVDNILLSLDNFGPPGTVSEYSTARTTNYPITQAESSAFGQTSRSRGYTISSRTSSEYSDTYETPPSNTARHQSNNSINFRSSLSRIDSVRINGQEEDSSRPSRFPLKTRGTGRDSGASSLELERPEPKYKKNRRSQSFDNGYIRMALRSNSHDPFLQDDQDASLPPSVPVVPRVQPSAALRPGASSSALPSNVHRRRDSDRSPVRPFISTTSEASSNVTETQGQDVNASDPVPGKVATSPGLPPTLHVKENQKPGFFRKMFGSSKTTQDNTQLKKNLQRPPQGAQVRPSAPPTEETPEFPHLQLLQRAPTKEKSSKDSQPLNKKTSFFRRRRKSVQDVPMPELPNMNQDKDDGQDITCPDSPSSLQRVMDQYYETHQRMESKSGTNSRRKNSLAASGVFSTIRTVGGPSASNSVSHTPQILSPKNQSRTSMERDMKSGKDVESREHKRSASSGSKLESKEKTKLSRHSPAHTRTQSDIDKDLPRLPVDYKALKSETPKEVPTSKYNNTTSKPPSRGSAASVTQTPPKHHTADNLGTSPSQQEWDSKAPGEVKASVPSIKSRATPTGSRATPVEDNVEDNDLADETKEALMFSVQDVDEPTDEQKAFALKLFDGISGMDRSEVAPWLGEADPERTKIRQAYMELFDWKDMSILGALRSFCSHIQLKGETQQVDRLLDALSRRWSECNPKHGFKATDVVHTICYSVLLLNTDLHMADIEQKMTRNQFIKNTMPTIRRVVADAAPNAFDNARASMLPPRRQTEPNISTSNLSPDHASDAGFKGQNRPSDHSTHDTMGDYDDCGPLVKSSFYGKLGGWESQVEVVLKNFYISIRNQRLPLSSGEEERRIDPHQSTLSLSAATGGMLRRTNSMLSKAGSETMPIRGRLADTRLGSRWSSKGRSRARLYPASLAQSRTSFDDDQSAISPSMSSMWSKHSLGRTTMSVTSFASGYPSAEYQRSIGFANALSQAITRSDSADESAEEFLRVGPLLEDESLELEGAPWAKEGILKHKHHLESIDKKAKDRNWNECFAVIEKGWIRLFQFNMNSKSTRQRSQKMMGGGVVGGGNWTENAQSLGEFLLRHTIASALPPPGYSKARPHVWALSLPTGAVHLFQAGTPEIVKEFVSTANYWSARLSKEPLTGGVSNIEYGWSERVINMALIDGSRPPSAAQGSRPSMSQSIRTSFDQSSSRPKLPGDKIIMSDWTPPTQSMMASQLLEVDQLRALQTYVTNIEEELRKHNELRSPMLLAFTPRQSNHARAMNNWERKSSYLLREIVKFSTYLESLQFAQKEMERVRVQKKLKEEEKEKMSEVQTTDGHEQAASVVAAAQEADKKTVAV